MGALPRAVMGNIPVVHEVCTSVGSLGDAIVGRPDKARRRWKAYAEESFFGSGIYAAVEGCKGNKQRARELGKGMGRATGKIICGGGILKEVPILHELATCGESLGDVIGGGECKKAAARWEMYAEESVFGSSIYAAVESSQNNHEHTKQLMMGCRKAAAKGVITMGAVVATVGVTIATAGAGTGVAVAAAGTTGAASGASATAGVQAVDGEIEPGDVVASALLGGAAGCIGGRLAAARGARPILGPTQDVAIARCISSVHPVSMGSMLMHVRERARARRYRSACTHPLEEETLQSVPTQAVLPHATYHAAASLVSEPPKCAVVVAKQPEGQVEECPICLEPQDLEEEADEASVLCGRGCAHRFHRLCLEEWRVSCETHGVEFLCPLCRTALE